MQNRRILVSSQKAGAAVAKSGLTPNRKLLIIGSIFKNIDREEAMHLFEPATSASWPSATVPAVITENQS
ncbi:MAG: hypothetical protein ABIL01_22500 [Pseudomonadota bacterium]